MLGRLVTQWADIVGPELAARTRPAGLRRFKAGKSSAVSLDIACTSSQAATLVYSQDRILACIRQTFGEGFVDALRFVPATLPAPKRPSRRETTKSLTADEKNYLSDVLGTVRDAELQARLESLGTAILQDRKP